MFVLLSWRIPFPPLDELMRSMTSEMPAVFIEILDFEAERPRTFGIVDKQVTCESASQDSFTQALWLFLHFGEAIASPCVAGSHDARCTSCDTLKAFIA
eukprot:1625999-Amphidinium_carterae.1